MGNLLPKHPGRVALVWIMKLIDGFLAALILMLCVVIAGFTTDWLGIGGLLQIILMFAFPLAVMSGIAHLLRHRVLYRLPAESESLYIEEEQLFLAVTGGTRFSKKRKYYNVRKITHVQEYQFVWVLDAEAAVAKYETPNILWACEKEFEKLQQKEVTPVKITVGKLYNSENKYRIEKTFEQLR